MKKYLITKLAVFMILIVFPLSACQQSGNTPVDEYISKIIISGENTLKGVPGSGDEFGRLVDAIRFSMQPQRRHTSLYSQVDKYYFDEIDKLDMYDDRLSNQKLYSQKALSSEAKEDIYYQVYLKQNPKHIFHPSQLKEGKVKNIEDNAWAYEGMSQDTKVVIVFTKNSELGLAAVILAPTLELAKQDYKKWKEWWESAGKAQHLEWMEREKKEQQERDKRAEYERQKPEREAAIAAVQQDMLSHLEFFDVKYEAIEDRGGPALLFKIKVKQSTENPVTSMACDIVIRNKDNNIVDIIGVEDRNRVNFEPEKIYVHSLGVQPQSVYRQNLVKKVSAGNYTAEIKPVQFFNGGIVPFPNYEIEKDLARNADGLYSYKGQIINQTKYTKNISKADLQTNIQEETAIQESEAKILEAKRTELGKKYMEQVSISFVRLTKKRADPVSFLTFTVKNNTGLALEKMAATYEVLEDGAIVKSNSFTFDIDKRNSTSPSFENTVYFFDGEPLLAGFENGTYTMRFEVKQVVLDNVVYGK